MLLPDNIHPENSIYYNGAFVIEVLQKRTTQNMLDLYNDVKNKRNMSFSIFVLCLDWLYLLDIAKINNNGGGRVMFIKSLTISSGSKIIREIKFHNGINLIVDETTEQITGNSVGKTTVLKLIDFCLGANPKNIYVDPETKRQEYKLVKDFLVNNKVLITLVLSVDLNNENAKKVVIERNFLARKEIIRRINDEQFTEDEFEIKLASVLFPNLHSEKPTFRQIISHNIRHRDESINNTLKTLDGFTSDAEYETLYLFLFGCDFSKGNSKQEILTKIKQEDTFKGRLEKNQTKTAYETTLALVNSDIESLNIKKSNFNLNENFETDLDKLNQLKYEINKLSSDISRLNLRKDLIKESEQDLTSSVSNIDLKQLEQIYKQATSQITNIQKTFDDLVHYHNQMISENFRLSCRNRNFNIFIQ